MTVKEAPNNTVQFDRNADDPAEPTIYDQSALNPKGTPADPKKCIQAVLDGTGWHFPQCSRLRGFGPGMKYCKQHAKKKEGIDSAVDQAGVMASALALAKANAAAYKAESEPAHTAALKTLAGAKDGLPVGAKVYRSRGRSETPVPVSLPAEPKAKRTSHDEGLAEAGGVAD